MIIGSEFPTNLFMFNLFEFNAILGMDRLSKYRAGVDCSKEKINTINSKWGRVTYKGTPYKPRIRVVSALETHKLLTRGCDAYLCDLSLIHI